MSRVERRLGSATIAHVALSVGDLGKMIAFYERIGFHVSTQTDFSPSPVRVSLMRNEAGASIELTAHEESVAVKPAASPTEAALERGLFHFAFCVDELDLVVADVVEAGATLVISPSPTSSGELEFAYLADPEGNLVELLSPLPGSANADPSSSDLR